ncbi:hypothetical protein [Mucilaginibacter flavus]|uniref:hypothetical protein n=1 Tax=Mucilaginibacter flavus TaxID=931504 RepID=UPI0025B2D764|nr:hypothetical protein [Mucilaginibacter flavus]MDN3583093.1 hypothetical protein [Mucilaginibacter flavus]
MIPINRISIILCLLIFYVGNNKAHAQLWKYIGDTPEKEKAFEKELSKEASSVITRKSIAYGDTFSYDTRIYTINSFDGHPAKISLWEKPFNGHVFHIDIPGDHLVIGDFSGLAKVHHLSNDILEIVYSPRGGSDQGYDNVLLLGVDKGKFCVLMEILSVNEYEMPGEYGLYQLHLKLSGKTADNYQLALHIRDLVKSNKPKKSFDKSSYTLLKFDKTQHIFYNETKIMDTVAAMYDGIGNTKKYPMKGVYPRIKLGVYDYFFANRLWYAAGKDTTGRLILVPNTVNSKSKK